MCDSTPNGNPNELQLDEIMTSQRIYHSPPHLSGRELEYLKNVIDTNWVAPVGPHLAEFEKIFCDCIGVKHALAVTTGTAAIHLALRHLDLHAGDESGSAIQQEQKNVTNPANATGYWECVYFGKYLCL